MNSVKFLQNKEVFIWWLKGGILLISGVMNVQVVPHATPLVEHNLSLHEGMHTLWLGGDEGLCICHFLPSCFCLLFPLFLTSSYTSTSSFWTNL